MPSLRDKRVRIKPKRLRHIPLCLTPLYSWTLPFPWICLSPWGTPSIPLQTATRETTPLWSGLWNGIPSATKYYCLNVVRPHLAWSSWAPGSHLCGTRCLVDQWLSALLESGSHWCGLGEPWVYKLHRMPHSLPRPSLCDFSLLCYSRPLWLVSSPGSLCPLPSL